MSNQNNDLSDESIKALLKQKQEELKIKRILINAVDEKAMERLDNIKAVNPEKWKNAVNYILMFYQRFGKRLSEADVINILKKLSPEKESKIRFIRK